MPEVNPYESPQHLEELASKAVTPHTTSIRAEAWRGAKFGGKIGAIAFLVVFIIAMLLLYTMNRPALKSETDVLQIIAGFFGALLYGLVAGAIIGAIIMGIIATIRKAMSKRRNKSRPTT